MQYDNVRESVQMHIVKGESVLLVTTPTKAEQAKNSSRKEIEKLKK